LRSRIAVVLIFLFSFVIAHDTVISVIADEQPPQECIHAAVSHDSLHRQYQQTDLGQLHAMFHFVALTPVCSNFFSSLGERKTLPLYEFRHTLYYIETSYKPPIA